MPFSLLNPDLTPQHRERHVPVERNDDHRETKGRISAGHFSYYQKKALDFCKGFRGYL